MNEENIKNNKVYGLFVNQELREENVYEYLVKWVANFELNVRLQLDNYKKGYFVDQNVLVVDTDGNRYTLLIKAAAQSLAPDILSCYTRKIELRQQLHIRSAKILSHYESRGIRYTRIGFVKLMVDNG